MISRFDDLSSTIYGFYEGGMASIRLELHGQDWSDFLDFCKVGGQLESVRFVDGALVIRRRPRTQTTHQTPSQEDKETSK